MSDSQEFRLERDSMGEFEVPADAYYGANTMRAVLNFPISDLRFGRSFIHAIAAIKLAAAQVNSELDLLPGDIADAIVTAASQVADGDFDDQFVVDIFQTGSGTSTNMNANEVISNRAIENLGGTKGSRSPVHPNDHVNIGQSSNDVIPTAIHIAALKAIHDELIPALEELKADLDTKADEFMPIVKTGRTHLQDATPVRLGQEFLGHAGQVERGIARLKEAEKELGEVALGGTAVGTGVNTHPEFAARVCARPVPSARRSGQGDHQPLPGAEQPRQHSRRQRRAQDRRRQPDEDKQRHSLARLRPPRRTRRNHAARSPAPEAPLCPARSTPSYPNPSARSPPR